MKCTQCRNKDVELLTRWERTRHWLFWKVNDVFFGEDMRDLTSEKYTQGYSDGYTAGVESERKYHEAIFKKYVDLTKPNA